MSAAPIRAATADDAPAIDALLADAFGGRAEADLVAAMRAAGNLALELVAENRDGIAGHVAFPRLASDAAHEAVALAPLSVGAELRGRGIGQDLIRHGFTALARSGLDWCLVLGDPAYYGRFGFSVEAARGFATPYDGPYQQAAALRRDVRPASGRLVYPPAFAGLG